MGGIGSAELEVPDQAGIVLIKIGQTPVAPESRGADPSGPVRELCPFSPKLGANGNPKTLAHYGPVGMTASMGSFDSCRGDTLSRNAVNGSNTKKPPREREGLLALKE